MYNRDGSTVDASSTTASGVSNASIAGPCSSRGESEVPALDVSPRVRANNHLLNRNSNRCADVWYVSTADGAAINQGTCNSGATSGC
jgi:hypothetical protein